MLGLTAPPEPEGRAGRSQHQLPWIRRASQSDDVIVAQMQSFRQMVRMLREFEGMRSLWRLPVAGLLYAAPAALLLATAVLGSYVASGGWKAETAVLSSFITLVGARVVFLLLRTRELHRRIVAKRLFSWERPNPATETPVHLSVADAEQASAFYVERGSTPASTGSRPATRRPTHSNSIASWPSTSRPRGLNPHPTRTEFSASSRCSEPLAFAPALLQSTPEAAAGATLAGRRRTA